MVSDSMFDLMMSSTKLPSAHETKEIDFVVGQGLWIIVAFIEYLFNETFKRIQLK